MTHSASAPHAHGECGAPGKSGIPGECGAPVEPSMPGESGAPALRGGYKAVFFDLDGTLLPMELEEFMGAYFGTLSAYMERVGMDPQTGKAALKAGVAAMMASEGAATNHDVFWAAFTQAMGPSADARDLEELMVPYYETAFGSIGDGVKPNPASAEAVAALAGKGYRLVCATMPMFPRRAVEWRLGWAQVDPASFELITTYENSRSTKPRTAYYQGILDATGLDARDVLMVGNNTLEDGAAAKLGCDVFLVTDFLLEGEGGLDVSATPHGTMEQFAQICKELPACR